MPEEPPQTVGDLRRKAIVTDSEIAEAVEAYLGNPEAATFEFASGHVLDLTAAVNAHRQAKAVITDEVMNDTFRRAMVRTAVILATPSEMARAGNRFGLLLPLQIEVGGESVRVCDRAGVVAADIYTSDEPERRQQTNRVTRKQGIEIAKVVARALTDQAQ